MRTGMDLAAAAVLAVRPGFHTRAVGRFDNGDCILLVIWRGGAANGIGDLGGHGARHLEPALVLADADRADFVAGDVPAAADQRQQPARFGIVAAADVHLEPHRVLETGAVAFGLGFLARFGCVGQQLLGLRQLGPVGVDQRGSDVLGRHARHDVGGELAVAILVFALCGDRLEQPRPVALGDRLGGGRIEPLGLDPRAAQHAFDPATAVIGHDDGRRALLARAARAARTVLERFRIARNFDMDHQAQRRQVDPTRGHIGGHADARPPVAQRLQCLVALALRMLARQRHDAETAILQRGVETPHTLARGAEADRRLRLVEAQQVDHRVLDFGRADGDALVFDIAVPARLAHQAEAQGIVLVAFGQPFDRARHGGGEQQRAAPLGRCIEDFFQILAKAHVEHLVRLVEHHADQARQVQRPAFEMVAQPPGRADDDRGAAAQIAPFLARIHPADAGGDANARPGIEPGKLAADLQRQFARGGDDQRERFLAQRRAA